MTCNFWDAKGNLLIDHLKKSGKIADQYYDHTFDQVEKKNCATIRPEMQENNIVIPLDNTIHQRIFFIDRIIKGIEV